MTLPNKIGPMLAQIADGPFDDPAFSYEIKWDGTRSIAFIERGQVRMHNRRFFDIGARYPELEALRGIPDGTVLDGEIVVLEDGRPSFTKIMQRDHQSNPERIAMLSARLPVTMMVFDVLYAAGRDMMREPLEARRGALAEVLADLDAPQIVMTDHIVEHGTAYFAAAEQHGLEGIIAKRLRSPYTPDKRSSDWLKIKVARTIHLDIIGYVPRTPTGPVSAILVASREGDDLVLLGKVGSGFNEEGRQALFEALSAAPPLVDPPAGGPGDAVWCACGLRCAVRYLERTAAGQLRAPVFVGIVES